MEVKNEKVECKKNINSYDTDNKYGINPNCCNRRIAK